MVDRAFRLAGLTAVLAMSGVAAGQSQAGTTFGGSIANDFEFAVGDVTTFDVTGTPGAPFATLVSTAARPTATAFGPLLPDAAHFTAEMIFNGFDPGHPAHWLSVLAQTGPGAGAYSLAVTPFAPGSNYAAAYYAQSLVADPTHPLGLRLSNAVTVRPRLSAPVLQLITPNLAAPGTAVQILGSNFYASTAAMTVRIGGLPVAVASATSTELWLIVPAEASSGPVVVAHEFGENAAAEGVLNWLAIAPGAPIMPVGAPPAFVAGHSIFEHLTPGETRSYAVELEAGQQVAAELYPWDVGNQRIAFPVQSGAAPTPDPVLKIKRPYVSPSVVQIDHASGPEGCAAFGAVVGAAHYVADAAETVWVEASFAHPQSYGDFVLVLGVKTAAGLPVTVQRIAPETAHEGDVVSVFGTAFDPLDLAGHVVWLRGQPLVPHAATISRLEFIVPIGARSGPIGVSTPNGDVLAQGERTDTWLAVQLGSLFFETEGVTPTLPLPSTYLGALDATSDHDDVLVHLVAGQRLSVEAYAFCFADGDVLDSTTFWTSIPDMEIRILHATNLFPFYIYEWNGGPGTNAMVGNGSTSTPAFVAPSTGLFRVKLTPAFFASTGEYIAILAIDP